MSFKILADTENMPYEEWLELRKKGIGGSDASIVCGINKKMIPVRTASYIRENRTALGHQERVEYGVKITV